MKPAGLALLFLIPMLTMLMRVFAQQDTLTYTFKGTSCDTVIDIVGQEAALTISFKVSQNGETVGEAAVIGNETAQIVIYTRGDVDYVVTIELSEQDRDRYLYSITPVCPPPSDSYEWYQYQADLIPAHPDLDYIDADYLRLVEADLGGRAALIEYLEVIHSYWIYQYSPQAAINMATLIPYQVNHYGESPTNEYHVYMTAHPVDMYGVRALAVTSTPMPPKDVQSTSSSEQPMLTPPPSSRILDEILIPIATEESVNTPEVDSAVTPESTEQP